MKESLPETPSRAVWLCNNLQPGSKVAVDFSLINHNEWKKLNDQMKSAGHLLVPVSQGNGLVEQVSIHFNYYSDGINVFKCIRSGRIAPHVRTIQSKSFL